MMDSKGNIDCEKLIASGAVAVAKLRQQLKCVPEDNFDFTLDNVRVSVKYAVRARPGGGDGDDLSKSGGGIIDLQVSIEY